MRILFVFLFLSRLIFSQDSAKARLVIRSLCSPEFSGRGYVNRGCEKAALFIQQKYKDLGLLPFKKNCFSQFYSASVNTFPDVMRVKINDKILRPGIDYIVSPESKGGIFKGRLIRKDSMTLMAQNEKDNTPIILRKEKKLTWSVSTSVENYCALLCLPAVFPNENALIEINIDQKWNKKQKLENVCGFVKGTAVPDSFIVISAHYDHLGKMGKETVFPGANDNASGVALMLSLAEYFSSHPLRYSVAFIAFSGEEAGLLGSKFYTENPLFPLHKIRFLINLDLLGTGIDGATVVNASIFPKEFALLNNINNEHQFLSQIKQRGKAQNSDHYYFTEKGVPSFFMYTMGGVSHYHDVYDREVTLPLTAYNNCFYLLKEFILALSGN
jgi:hypothetical protein